MNVANDRARPAAVVTGVSSGIGLAIAEDLLQHGYQVFGSVRRVADAEGLVKRWGEAFVPLLFDVTNAGALPQAVAQVEAIVGERGLTALINNAGIGLNGPIVCQPMSEVRQVFEVNFFGLLEVTRAFLPLLGMRPGAKQRGRIVNIGSISGGITAPFMGAYSASKHAVEALTQALRRELKLYGIEASCIEPGFIRTRILDTAVVDKMREQYTHTDYKAWWQQFTASLLAAAEKAKPVEIVTRAVRHAIESRKPRSRYPLDPLWMIGRVISDRAFDKLIFKLTGLDKLLR